MTKPSGAVALIWFVLFTAPTSAAQPNANPTNPANGSGIYECRTGAVTAIAVNKEATVTKFDATSPLLRLEIAQVRNGGPVIVRAWDVNSKAWLAASPSDSLVITRAGTFSDGWGLTFEGVIGGSPSTAISMKAFLGQGTGAAQLAGVPADKPILNFTTLSDFRGASAGSALCDKVG
jgi:hypothetical protein